MIFTEIKHSDKMVYDQTRHLTDEEKIALTERRFGEIKGRYVLYRGETAENEMGILYRNVSDYLKGLPDTAMPRTSDRILTKKKVKDLNTKCNEQNQIKTKRSCCDKQCDLFVYRKPRHSGGVQKRLTDVERQKNSDCVRIEATCQSQTRNNTIGGHYNE